MKELFSIPRKEVEKYLPPVESKIPDYLRDDDLWFMDKSDAKRFLLKAGLSKETVDAIIEKEEDRRFSGNDC